MLDFFLWVAIAILAASALCMYRVVFGPTVIDRIIGLNALSTMTIAVILCIGLIFKQVEFFIDIAFTYALINFIGALAFAKYFGRQGAEKQEEVR